MYLLSDNEITFISEDVRSRGIRLDDLHDSLLDHLCCIIENEYDGQGEFKLYYEDLIQRFYTNTLQEIEEETLLLLTFKNHEKMKKMTNMSGVFAASVLSIGLFFKFMHWPGAAALILAGIVTAALFFMPLQFIMRSRKSVDLRETTSLAFGSLLFILLSLHVLFKVFHWPGAAVLFYSCFTVAILYIVVYFFSGFNKPTLKERTVLNTLLMVLACGLLLTLMRTPKTSLLLTKYQDAFYAQTLLLQQPSAVLPADSTARLLNAACEQLKTDILKTQPTEVINGKTYRVDAGLQSLYEVSPEIEEGVSNLIPQILHYSSTHQKTILSAYEEKEINDMMRLGTAFSALAYLTQVQLALYQARL